MWIFVSTLDRVQLHVQINTAYSASNVIFDIFNQRNVGAFSEITSPFSSNFISIKFQNPSIIETINLENNLHRGEKGVHVQ